MKTTHTEATITESIVKAGFISKGIAFDRYDKKYSVYEKDGSLFHCRGLDLQTNEINFTDISDKRLRFK